MRIIVFSTVNNEHIAIYVYIHIYIFFLFKIFLTESMCNSWLLCRTGGRYNLHGMHEKYWKWIILTFVKKVVHNKSLILRIFLWDATVVLTTLRLGRIHIKYALFWSCLAILTFLKRILNKI